MRARHGTQYKFIDKGSFIIVRNRLSKFSMKYVVNHKNLDTYFFIRALIHV